MTDGLVIPETNVGAVGLTDRIVPHERSKTALRAPRPGARGAFVPAFHALLLEIPSEEGGEQVGLRPHLSPDVVLHSPGKVPREPLRQKV